MYMYTCTLRHSIYIVQFPNFNCTSSLSLFVQVLLEGRGLTGASELFVDANSRSLYTLTYAPQRIGRSRGMVLFTGREDGEIMIEFELLAEDPKSVDLGTAECELGK